MKKLSAILVEKAEKTALHFENKLQSDGSLGGKKRDLACYFKIPMFLAKTNRKELAEKVIKYISNNYQTSQGDFKTEETLKSVKQEYIDYWYYMNGWIIRAENALGIYDEMANRAYEYFERSYFAKNKTFLTHSPEIRDGVTDILTSAHGGLINLERGEIDLAKNAADFLEKAITQQSIIDDKFYLRFDKDLFPITDLGV